MKKNLLECVFSVYFLALSFFAYSQTGGVSINTTNTPAHPSAILDVNSTSAPYLGMLIPRMSTAHRNSIISPATGLQIFNTDCGINEYYTGTCWISMGQNLKTPDLITCSGTTDFCANETRTFTIPPLTGATTYKWTVPAGAKVTSGQGTTSVIVVFGNNSGDVCVTAENLCETSLARCIDIHINPVPQSPGNITGLTTVAPGTSATYFIASVAGAGVYNWTVPPGATIASGVGTTTITVNFSCSAVSGNISVNAQSNCGVSVANTLAITLIPVLLVNAGPGITSPGTLGGSPTASGGATPYIYAWTPSTSLSNTAVANPTTTVCPTTTYTVTVTDANGCSKSSSAAAVSSIPATPGPITGNTSPTCSSTGNVYSISPVTYATSYAWTVPSGNTITSGQGTSSIAVSFLGASGNITVTAGNNCGTSSARTLAITVSGGGGSGSQTFNATGSGRTGSIQTFTVPACVAALTIEAIGAEGGSGGTNSTSYIPGKGARIKASFTVSSAAVFNILVGQKGIPSNDYGGGGGGGSFVLSSGTAYVVAGGGGGVGYNIPTTSNGVDAVTTTSGTADNVGNGAGGSGGGGGGIGSGSTWCGAGGGGYSGNGTTPACSATTTNAPGTSGGISYTNGGVGGTAGNATYSGAGGYGGGGASAVCGGGGGGYSGGAGGGTTSYNGGGGGGSYIAPAGTPLIQAGGYQTGNGQVIITW